jgi:hypothetical protein
MKYITVATAVAFLVGLAVGTAYGDKIPVVGSALKKLPGASKPAAA